MNRGYHCVLTATLGLAVMILTGLYPAPALAHKLNVYGYQEGELMHLEGYFFDGSRCMDCSIQGLDQTTGVELGACKTDRGGRCSFKIQKVQKGPIRLVLEAGAGHKAEYIVNVSEAPAEADQGSGAPQSASETELDRALERKLGPIRAELSRLREASERPGLTEILGGIGYIVGIFGILAYYKSRTQKSGGKG